VPTAEPCPPEDTLAAFAAGRVAGDEFDRVCRHLHDCPRCKARLAALDGRVPTVVQDLRKAPLVFPETAAQSSPPAETVEVRVGRGLTEETRGLLRRRLLVVGTLTTVTAAIFAFTQVARIDDSVTAAAHRRSGQVIFFVLGVLSAASVVWLRARPGLSLRALRGLELFDVAAMTAFAVHYRWAVLAGTADRTFANDDHRALYVEQAVLVSNLAWYLIIVGYGLLIPNTLRRCALVVGWYAAAALGSTVVIGLALESVGDQLPFMLAMTGVGVFMTGTIAVFGSYKISTLQAEVVAARQLGPYALKRKLGAGGMGEVYLAEHGLLKRPCAVKVIRPEKASDPDQLRRFEREVQTTARLTHPNTVEVFDYGRTADGTFYYVMEYLDGPTLSELVKRHGPVPAARGVYFLRQLCGALREAHGIGLVHRDVKPGNVIVCELGGVHDVVKLLDFGLVHADRGFGADGGLTREGMVMGTPDYVSPEQAAGLPVDGRSDVYSLGALAYFLFAGRPPFQTGSVLDTLIAHRQQDPPPLRGFSPGMPSDVEAVVMRCLAKRPADRFPDVRSLDDALAACGCAGGWTEETAAAWWRERGRGVGKQDEPV
jgi:serine/threonine-protein kinase